MAVRCENDMNKEYNLWAKCNVFNLLIFIITNYYKVSDLLRTVHMFYFLYFILVFVLWLLLFSILPSDWYFWCYEALNYVFMLSLSVWNYCWLFFVNSYIIMFIYLLVYISLSSVIAQNYLILLLSSG